MRESIFFFFLVVFVVVMLLVFCRSHAPHSKIKCVCVYPSYTLLALTVIISLGVCLFFRPLVRSLCPALLSMQELDLLQGQIDVCDIRMAESKKKTHRTAFRCVANVTNAAAYISLAKCRWLLMVLANCKTH